MLSFDLAKLSKNCCTEPCICHPPGQWSLRGTVFLFPQERGHITVRYVLPQLLILQFPGVQSVKFRRDGHGQHPRLQQGLSEPCKCRHILSAGAGPAMGIQGLKWLLKATRGQGPKVGRFLHSQELREHRTWVKPTCVFPVSLSALYTAAATTRSSDTHKAPFPFVVKIPHSRDILSF